MEPFRTAHERRQMPRILERRGAGQLIVDHAHMGRVAIDPELCGGCRLCVRVCPARALEMHGDNDVRMVGEYAACIACGDCVAVCESDAIKLTEPLRYDGFYKTIGRGALTPPRRF